MATTREQVFAAVFQALQGIPGITSTSRRVTLSTQVADADLPRLMLWEEHEKTEQPGHVPAKRTWAASIVIFFRNGDPDVPGSTILNPLIEGVEAAFPIDDFANQQCTLGGLVRWVQIMGDTVKMTGDTNPDGLGGCVIPIRILVP